MNAIVNAIMNAIVLSGSSSVTVGDRLGNGPYSNTSRKKDQNEAEFLAVEVKTQWLHVTT